MDNIEINDRFSQHSMNRKTSMTSTEMRGEITELAHKINEDLPDCREKSIAMTKLEEVLMWFNKGLARSDG